MEWDEFYEKYKLFNEHFNSKHYDDRVFISRLMFYEAIRELIRSKKHLREAIAKIDERINQLKPQLDEFLKSKAQ